MEASNELIREILLEVKSIKEVITDHTKNGNSEKLLDNTDVREMLHVSTRTLQRLRQSGMLKHSKVNGKIYYRLADIHSMLEQNQSQQ